MSAYAEEKHRLELTGYRLNGNSASDKLKQEFFRTEAVPVRLYGCTIWSLMKLMEKIDGNYTSIQHAVLKIF